MPVPTTFQGDPIVNRPPGIVDMNHYLNQESFLEESMRGIYDANNNLIYVGFAKVGASELAPVWQIQKFAYDGNNNLINGKWPVNTAGVASSDYEFVWDAGAGGNYTDYTYV